MSESFLTAFSRSHERLMLYHLLCVRSETHYLIVVVNERKYSFQLRGKYTKQDVSLVI